MADEVIVEQSNTPLVEVITEQTQGPKGDKGDKGDSGSGGGASGFTIGTTAPVAAGEYLFVQTDGNGNFIDLIVGKN